MKEMGEAKREKESRAEIGTKRDRERDRDEER